MENGKKNLMLQGFGDRQPGESAAEWHYFVKANWEEIVKLGGHEYAKRCYGSSLALLDELGKHSRESAKRRAAFADVLGVDYFDRGNLYVHELDGEYNQYLYSPIRKLELVGQSEWIETHKSSKLGNSPAFVEPE